MILLQLIGLAVSTDPQPQAHLHLLIIDHIHRLFPILDPTPLHRLGLLSKFIAAVLLLVRISRSELLVGHLEIAVFRWLLVVWRVDHLIGGTNDLLV